MIITTLVVHIDIILTVIVVVIMDRKSLQSHLILDSHQYFPPVLKYPRASGIFITVRTKIYIYIYS